MSESENKLKATIITGNNNKVEKTFIIDVQKDLDNNSSHLNSLRNCVNSLQTQLNQYLTQIIDEENGSNLNNNHNNGGQELKDKEDKEQTSDDSIEDKTDEPKQKKYLFPILRDPIIFNDIIEIMIEHIQKLNPKVEAIIGLESRGFLLAPVIALRLKLPFIPIRKSGKLPGSVLQATYALEYGSDKLEIQCESITNGLKCVLIDDLIATGGSLKASIDLVNQLNGQVIGVMVIMELVALNGRKTIPSSLYSMIQY